jgi:hypothetical protein
MEPTPSPGESALLQIAREMYGYGEPFPTPQPMPMYGVPAQQPAAWAELRVTVNASEPALIWSAAMVTLFLVCIMASVVVRTWRHRNER